MTGVQTCALPILPGGEHAGESAKLPALPLEMAGERFGLRHDVPRQGQHTAEVLGELGYSEEDIAGLFERDLAAGE